MTNRRIDLLLVVGLIAATAYCFRLVWGILTLLIRTARPEAHSMDGWYLLALLLAFAFVVWGIRWTMKSRRKHYPSPGGDVRVFLTVFFYGKELTWKEAVYKVPKNWSPSFAFASVSLAWMCPAVLISEAISYLSTANVDPDTSFLYFVLGTLLVAASAVAAPIVLGRLLWLDYLESSQPPNAVD